MNDTFNEWLGDDTERLRAFASKLGVTESSVYRWKRGGPPPNRGFRNRIEKATKGAVPASSWVVPPRKKRGSAC
jgi:transcriptional regulator with XRE-family HTH domain